MGNVFENPMLEKRSQWSQNGLEICAPSLRLQTSFPMHIAAEIREAHVVIPSTPMHALRDLQCAKKPLEIIDATQLMEWENPGYASNVFWTKRYIFMANV